MKGKGGLLVLAAVAGLGIYTYVKKQTKKFVAGFRATVKDIGFDFKKFSESFFTKLFFPVQLNVENTSDSSVKVNGVDFVLTNKGNTVAKGRLRSEVILPPRKISTLRFTVTVGTVGAVGTVQEIIRSIRDNQTMQFNASGEVELSVGVVKFEKDFTI